MLLKKPLTMIKRFNVVLICKAYNGPIRERLNEVCKNFCATRPHNHILTIGNQLEAQLIVQNDYQLCQADHLPFPFPYSSSQMTIYNLYLATPGGTQIEPIQVKKRKTFQSCGELNTRR